MARRDICPQVIHFTKGPNPDEAFNRLRTILYEGRLRGGTGNIKGGYTCVCFTEAPLEVLPQGFVNSTAFSRYSPFGIMFDKRWLFEQGGRPVIYQADADYAALPEALRWRHVRYEPHGAAPIDFTWEREWRIRADELLFNPGVATVVLPSRHWYEALRHEHEAAQDSEIDAFVMAGMTQHEAEQHRQGFPWAGVWLE